MDAGPSVPRSLVPHAPSRRPTTYKTKKQMAIQQQLVDQQQLKQKENIHPSQMHFSSSSSTSLAALNTSFEDPPFHDYDPHLMTGLTPNLTSLGLSGDDSFLDSSLSAMKYGDYASMGFPYTPGQGECKCSNCTVLSGSALALVPANTFVLDLLYCCVITNGCN